MQQAETQTTGGVTQHPPGTRLREYETIFLVRPDLAEDLVDKTVERLRGVSSREGGKGIKATNMGKKKTAFEATTHPRAIFIPSQYLAETKLVTEAGRNTRT